MKLLLLIFFTNFIFATGFNMTAQRPLGDHPSSIIQEGKYKGMVYVKNVDIFVENKRTFSMPSGEKKTIDFTPRWCEQAIENAQYKFQANGFLAPSHIGHNGKDGEEREAAGLFLPTRLETSDYQGNQKMIVFADLIMPMDVWEEAKNLKLPYRSVEIEDPKVPSFSSLAFLRSRPPFMETSPLLPYMTFTKTGSVLCFSASSNVLAKRKYAKACYDALKDHFNIEDPDDDELEFASRVLRYGGPGSGPDTLNRVKGENLDGSFLDKMARALHDPIGLARKIGNPFTIPGRIGANLIDKASSLIHDNDSPWENEMEKRGAFSKNAKFGIRDKLEEGAYRINIAATDAGKALKDKLRGAPQQAKASANSLAQKMADNWGSVKVKLMSNPKYQSLLKWIDEDIAAGSGPRGGWTNAENVASMLKTALSRLPPDHLDILQSFLFTDKGEGVQYTKPMDPLSRGKATKAKLKKIEAAIPELEALIQKYKSQETDRSAPADLPAAKKRLSRRVARAEELQRRLVELRRYVRTHKGQGRGSVGFSDDEEMMEEGEEMKKYASGDESDQIEDKIEALEEEAKSDFSAEDEMPAEAEVEGESPVLSEAAKQGITDILTGEGFSMDQAMEMVAKLLPEEEPEAEPEEAAPEIETFQRSKNAPFKFSGDRIKVQVKDKGNAINETIRFLAEKSKKQEREIKEMKMKDEINTAIKYAKNLSDGFQFSHLIAKEVPARYRKEGKEGVKRMVETWKDAVTMHHPVDLDSAHFTANSSSDEQDKLDFISKHPQFSDEIEDMSRTWKKIKKENPSYQYSHKEHIDHNLYPLIHG